MNGGCTPSWDGTDPVSSDTQVGSVINEVRGAGGDVIVSAGGYNGTKLGQVCGSASATAAAYQQVITKYGLHAMDFDLEEPEIESSAAIANELGAAQILQQDNPGLIATVTIPSTPTGANYFGGLLLNSMSLLYLGWVRGDWEGAWISFGVGGAVSVASTLTAPTHAWLLRRRLDKSRGVAAVPMLGGRTRGVALVAIW